MIAARNIFANAADLAQRLAQDVAKSLSDSINQKGEATLAVSGGTTPVAFFRVLSCEQLAWKNVTLTLVDERQVDESNARSNARLVKQALMQNQAAKARFVPLFQNPQAGKLTAFDVAVLGMGNDGHTASFFPQGDHLHEAFAENAPALIDISAPGSGEPRITFTLPKLLTAKNLILHIQGQDKWATLEKALGAGDILEMPVRAVLRANKPVDLYWCP